MFSDPTENNHVLPDIDNSLVPIPPCKPLFSVTLQIEARHLINVQKRVIGVLRGLGTRLQLDDQRKSPDFGVSVSQPECSIIFNVSIQYMWE